MGAVDIGTKARDTIDRLLKVDRKKPLVDCPRVEAAFAEHLRVLGLEPLPVRWFEDSASAYKHVTSAAESAAWSAARSAARSAAWSAAGRDVPELVKMEAIWLPFADAFEAGLWLFWVTPTEIIAVGRPAIQFDNDRLHCETGPAVTWPTGESYWFWKGVQVTKDIVEQPDSIDVVRIDRERNAEVRRVMLERFTLARYIKESGAEVLDEDEHVAHVPIWSDDGQEVTPQSVFLGTQEYRSKRRLLRKRLPEGDLVMVQVSNSTPEPDGVHKDYLLCCHPQLRPLPTYKGASYGAPQKMTCQNAIASLVGMRGEDYHPDIES